MGRRLSSVAAAAVAAVLAATFFTLVYPHDPHPPGSDLYTHLGIARHLVRGEGFLNDCVYPFSLAFPFAARVPQPVLHRPPGAPLLFTLPCWAGGGEPEAVVAHVRSFWLVLFGLVCAVGASGALSRGDHAIVLPWLATLVFNPLTRSTVSGGQIEVPAAVLLLAIWVHWPNGPGSAGARPRISALLLGILAGGLTMLRPELFWVPWLWWLCARSRPPLRLLLVTALGQTMVCAPWAVRNLVVTGNPLFNLQFYGIDWTTYRSLSPEAFTQILAHEPERFIAKLHAGLVFFAERPHRWLPWPLWGAAALTVAAAPWRGNQAAQGLAATRRLRLLLLTLALLTAQYAALSHELRFMFTLLPIVSLEIWAALAAGLWRHPPAARAPDSDRAPRPGATAGWLQAVVLSAFAALVIWLAPPIAPGLARERAAAGAAAPAIARGVAEAASLPPGPIFTDSSAVVWYSGRPGVWRPLSAEIELAIRERLPEMREAACIYVLPESTAVAQ